MGENNNRFFSQETDTVSRISRLILNLF